MKKIQKCNKLNNSESNVNLKYFSEDILLLDIETTGLSPDTGYIYIIGAAYQTGCSLVIQQFFAESAEEEPLLLQEAQNLLRHFSTLATYRGSGFDLPFLEKRGSRLGIPADYLDKFKTPQSSAKDVPGTPYFHGQSGHIDLYKMISGYKHILNLENYKQKTVENFLHITRGEACYPGRQLIKFYHTYQKTQDPELLHLLLAHNQADIQGMAGLLSLCALEELFYGNFEPVSCNRSNYTKIDGALGQEFMITCRFPEPFPVSFSCGNDTYYLHVKTDGAVIFRVRLYEGVLKYFYPNYKDYYYLPAEDTVMHKSVAAYVDKAHRKKATAASCYTKKTGCFLPQYEEVITPAFYKNYKDPVSYFELPQNPGDDLRQLKAYCMHILKMLRNRPEITCK